MHRRDEEKLLRQLRRLPIAEPDAPRLEYLRAQCHAAILQREEEAERRRIRRQLAARILEPALVGGLSVSYLVAILLVVLGLRGIHW